MNKCIIITLICFASVFSANAEERLTSEIKYVAPPMIAIGDGESSHFSSSSVTINYIRKSIDYGDASTPIELSPKNSKWFSFHSGILNFAINRSWKQLPDDWQYKEFTYSNQGSMTLELLGSSISCNAITVRRNNSDDVDVVLYSPNAGIVGFYRYDNDEDSVEVFYMQGKKGIKP